GLPVGSALNASWDKISGPGAVVFDDAHSAATTASFGESGIYVLRLTANDSLVSRTSDVTLTVNHAPVVDAGSDQLVTNLQAILHGTVFDDGLPNGTLTSSWSKVSGPGNVAFENVNSATTTATFSSSGVYVLQLTADDSLAQTSAQVTISVDGAPVVDATSDSPVNSGNTVTLSGTATDDGLPNGSTLTYSWNQVSGPGGVSFSDATASQTTASFTASGTYVVLFSASDSLLAASTQVTVIVNGAPTVNAGANQIITLPQAATLVGTVSDDGLPNGNVSVNWNEVSGPGVVTFGSANAAMTTATFSDSGVYLLRLTANDGLATANSDVTVTVNRAPTVNAGSDQVVTNLQAVLNGSVSDDGLPTGTVTSSWTEVSGPGVATFANSSSPATTVTFSATGVYVLRLTADDSLAQSSAQVTIVVDGTPVVSATSDSPINLPASATLIATATDDALPVGSTLTHVWTKISGPGAVTFGDATALQTTASFSQSGIYVIQFSASDSLLTSAANLTLVVNTAPTVNAGINQAVNFPNSVNLAGSVTDDGIPQGAPITATWSQVSGPGTVSFSNNHSTSTSATASSGGVYVLRLTADDTLATNSADVTVKFNRAPVAQAQSVNAPEGQTTSINLVGSDADGDALQFVVTQSPLLGALTGTAPNLVYTAYSGAYGADSFQFYVTDGMLTSAVATVSIQVAPFARGRTYTLNSDFLEGNIVNLQATNDQLQLLRSGSGSWTVVFDSGLINAPWAGLSWNGLVPNDGSLSVSVAISQDGKTFSAPQPITLENSQPTNTGRYLMVAVNFVPATSGESPILQDLTVGTVGWPVPEAVPQWQISAGDDLNSLWPDPLQLKGVVWRSPHNIAVNPAIQWSLLSGPGTVTFDNPTNVQPTVQFSTNGTYQFRITANNNGDIKTDDMTVTVTAFNRAPVVYAGPNMFVRDFTTGPVVLKGSATDDGLPLTGTLKISWTQLFGSGTTTFANSNSPTSSATFSANGIYILQLSADDGQFVTKSITTVRVGVICTVDSPAGLEAWWQANASGVDVVNGNQAILETGANYGQGEVGGAFNFDGVNARVSVAANPHIDLAKAGNPGFTVELWINPNTLLNGAVMGWTNGVRFERISGSATGDTLRFYVTGTNSGQFVDSARNWSTAATLNKWYHYAATYDRASGVAKVYFNGVLQNTVTVGANQLSTSAGFYMGQVPGVAGAFKGQLDEISLYGRALDPEEIYNIFTSGAAGKCPLDTNQAPVVDAGPDLFLKGVPATTTLNGKVSDDGLPNGSSVRIQWSKLGGPGTVTFGNTNAAVTTATFSTNGVYVLQLAADDQDMITTSLVEVRVETLCTIDDPQGLVAWWPGNNNDLDMVNGFDAIQGSGEGYTTGKVGSAFNFNGTNNYVWMPAQSNYDVGSSASGFTVEFWMNPNSFQAGSVLGWANGVRVERSTSGSAVGDTLRFVVVGTNTGQFLDAQRPWPTSATLNQWYHIAVTYDRTLGQAKVYTNGVLLATGTVGTSVLSTAGDFYLGQVPGSANFFSGALDEISIYKRPLNPEEVYNVFTSGSTGKCPDDANQPPIVYAGEDLFVRGVPGTATLNGQVIDDNLPAGSSVRSQWSKFSGPGTVTFANPSALTTSATFSTNGVYVLQLTADDGEAQDSDLMEVRVETLCTVEHPQGLAAWWPGNGASDDLVNGYHALLGSGTTYTNGVLLATGTVGTSVLSTAGDFYLGQVPGSA
ncbi:MAG: PKD domain-containing protein, partial [Limisphaerales bacterium]